MNAKFIIRVVLILTLALGSVARTTANPKRKTEIAVAIENYIDGTSKRSADGRFNVKYQGRNLGFPPPFLPVVMSPIARIGHHVLHELTTPASMGDTTSATNDTATYIVSLPDGKLAWARIKDGTLIMVHDDRLLSLGGGSYSVCVDMIAGDGRVYDVDFVFNRSPGNVRVAETSVHRVNRKPLYDWRKEGGVWKKLKT